MIDLATIFWSVYRRCCRTWAVVWRPDVCESTGDRLTVNHNGHSLDAKDSTMADGGNHLKFLFAAKIYGSYGSPLYIYHGVSMWPYIEIRLPQVKIRPINRAHRAVARAVRLILEKGSRRMPATTRVVITLQRRCNDGKHNYNRIERHFTRIADFCFLFYNKTRKNNCCPIVRTKIVQWNKTTSNDRQR